MMSIDNLAPCRECGAPCRVEEFDGELAKATLWLCSQHKMFGGTCPSVTAYLTAEAWDHFPAGVPLVVELAYYTKEITDTANVPQRWARACKDAAAALTASAALLAKIELLAEGAGGPFDIRNCIYNSQEFDAVQNALGAKGG